VRRILALALPLLLVAVALTGCVKNLPDSAVDWLGEQDGVSAASILADNTGPWSSSGLVRGELDPGIGDADIQKLIGKIQDFATQDGGVSFWLGIDDLDFVVVSGDNTANVGLWRDVLDVPGLVSGIVSPDDVRVRTLRPDAVAALDDLAAFASGVRLEAFSDAEALAADAAADVQYDQVNVLALEFRRPAGCTPDAPVLDFAESLLDRDTIPGATIDLCTGITLDLPAEEPMAGPAVDLRAELDERGLSEFPVQLTSEDAAGNTRFAAIAPGDAKLLEVLATLEQPDAPAMSYSLSPDGTLALTAYEVPTTDLLALVQGAPAASGLANIGLEGAPVAVLGTLEQLPRLLDEATALDAASDTFGSVQLGQGFGSVFLDAGVGADPDVATAVADLRATGVTDRRFFSVKYKSFQLDIVNNVAALSDEGYTGAEVMQQFCDLWNAG
jgi:hypothetical protein